MRLKKKKKAYSRLKGKKRQKRDKTAQAVLKKWTLKLCTKCHCDINVY